MRATEAATDPGARDDRDSRSEHDRAARFQTELPHSRASHVREPRRIMGFRVGVREFPIVR
ncbi:Hypothetical protein A7982_05530 [Minicystis rosea]|nr:Hypothetical protein A7982_05530 [Minicystis rosea]